MIRLGFAERVLLPLLAVAGIVSGKIITEFRYRIRKWKRFG
jgi:hypothetical protein